MCSLAQCGRNDPRDQSTEVPGGKGANQAVAAARLGVPVAMIGRVGTDSFSDRLCRNLELETIDVSGVMPTPNAASGLAVIAVDATGQNTIIVVPNADLTAKDVDACIGLLQDAAAVLLQLETPLATVLHTVRRAKQMGLKVVLDRHLRSHRCRQNSSALMSCALIKPKRICCSVCPLTRWMKRSWQLRNSSIGEPSSGS